jgi:hypothetical protein
MSGQQIRGAYASKLPNAESWQAWRVGERESDAATLDAPTTLDEAIAQAMATMCWHPGDTLAVLYTHTGLSKRTLWLHTIRSSTKRYSWRQATDGGRPVKVAALEPKLILQTEVAAFAPIERFDAFRHDPAGVDLHLVEQR